MNKTFLTFNFNTSFSEGWSRLGPTCFARITARKASPSRRTATRSPSCRTSFGTLRRRCPAAPWDVHFWNCGQQNLQKIYFTIKWNWCAYFFGVKFEKKTPVKDMSCKLTTRSKVSVGPQDDDLITLNVLAVTAADSTRWPTAMAPDDYPFFRSAIFIIYTIYLRIFWFTFFNSKAP